MRPIIVHEGANGKVPTTLSVVLLLNDHILLCHLVAGGLALESKVMSAGMESLDIWQA